MIYDVIIIWWWAAGLFAGIQLDKKYTKLVLEKTKKPGMKVLLSGGERANVSNMDIQPTRDYFTQNKKFLHSIFARYSQWDIMSFFAENGVAIVEEDRSRLILESGNSRELLSCLLDNLEKNNGEVKIEQDVVDIEPIYSTDTWNTSDTIKYYKIKTREGKTYTAQNVILSSGWKSFGHVGTTGEGYSMAEKLWIEMVVPYRTLSGMATNRELKEVSGVSSVVDMELVDKQNWSLDSLEWSGPQGLVSLKGEGSKNKVKNKKNKAIYQEKGPILFTHFGVSGPIIHNLSNAIGEYLNNLWLEEEDFERYIIDNLSINLDFDLENTAKRLIKFFELCPSAQASGFGGEWIQWNTSVNLELQNWRSWKEAKATGWGISTDNLDNHMQVKKYPGLYCIGEVIDITGKTGWFNLQWAWSSAFVAAEKINLQCKK